MKPSYQQKRSVKTHIRMMVFISCMMLYLSSCSSLNSNFECPMKPGIRCESLDQISARVERGEINNYSNLTSSCSGSSCPKSSCRNCVTPISTLLKQPPCKSCASQLLRQEPLRYGETVQHVWIAPFEDTAGNYHQESDIYTIVKPGHWIGHPPKELTSDED